ncbi:metal-dependent hydrolase [Silvibacterium sp.]|uniref:metal-dependent hydrolase n=1 Tax=Silvibacterium sp. TaxID=1964179 RepID=UPI0039E63C3F
MADFKGTSITWLGHASVLITTAQGTQILIDPFFAHSPTFPKGYKLPEKLDLLALTHGHSDHIADAEPVAKEHKPQVVGMVELVGWLASKGVENTVGMNLGGTYRYKDVAITLVDAKHSSSIQDGDETIYAGVASGIVFTIENGPVIYHAGDTSLFSDLKLIGELYRPEIGLLPIGDHYTMGPKEAAIAASYLGLKAVIPIHWGTFPALTGTPEALKQHLASGIRAITLAPGETAK